MALAVMFNTSLILDAGPALYWCRAGDTEGRRDSVQKEEDEEIIEVLEILEEYDLLRGMEILEREEVEEGDKPNPGRDKESEKE